MESEKKAIAILLNYPIQNAVDVGILEKDKNFFTAPLESFDEVHVISPRTKKPPIDLSLGPRVVLHCVNSKYYWLSPIDDFFALIKLIKSSHIKVIRALAPTSGLTAVIAGWLTNTPVVVSVHTDQDVAANDSGQSPLKRTLVNIIEPFVLKRASVVPVISEHIKRYALAKGARAGKIVDHPNFVDLHQFSLHKTRKGYQVLFVGRLSPVKGILEAVRAFKRVKEEYPNATLVVAGSGELEAAAKQEASASILKNSVKFLGTVQHETLAGLYAESSVFLAPATAGYTLIEAMASGIPIVAADLDWAAEELGRGKLGLVIPAYSEEEAAKAIDNVFQHPAKAAARAEAARARAQRYSLESWIERENEVYQQAIGVKKA